MFDLLIEKLTDAGSVAEGEDTMGGAATIRVRRTGGPLHRGEWLYLDKDGARRGPRVVSDVAPIEEIDEDLVRVRCTLRYHDWTPRVPVTLYRH